MWTDAMLLGRGSRSCAGVGVFGLFIHAARVEWESGSHLIGPAAGDLTW